jgi:hypothetical protein
MILSPIFVGRKNMIISYGTYEVLYILNIKRKEPRFLGFYARERGSMWLNVNKYLFG